MALIRLSDLQIPEDLTIDMPNITLGNVEYKRRMTIRYFRFFMQEKTVTVETVIDLYYKNEDNTYGDIVDYNATNYAKQISYTANATMTKVCNAQTGQHICKVQDIPTVIGSPIVITNEDGTTTTVDPDPLPPYYGVNYMYEYEFFFMIATAHPIILKDMIRQFMQAEIQSGRVN